MCGRYGLAATPEEVAELLGVMEIDGFPHRYNIAPTQPILAVISGERQELGSNRPDRQALLMRWGLIPGWVKDTRDFPLLINARSETAITKASFRAAMRHRRVLIPATGFYEWQRPAKDSSDSKAQAYWIRPKNGGVIAFAGLMETYSSTDGSEIDTGTILTVAANPSLARIHDRMPVIIAPEDFARWLDCKTQEPRQIADLMVPAAEDFFEIIAVSDRVNKVSNLGPDLLEPVDAAALPAVKPKRGAADSGQMSLF